ncbi:hypothetical protein O3G_MSEX008175, partial [Manduca sexta]
MTQIGLISLAVILVTNCLADLDCGQNEVAKSCADGCHLNVCPKSRNFNASCSALGLCSSSLCDCRFNYKRAENGTCIPTKDCPKFDCDGENEEYVACPPFCPRDDCSQATSDGRCPNRGYMLFVVECQPACRCIKGYWRNNGVCVPYQECPQ